MKEFNEKTTRRDFLERSTAALTGLTAGLSLTARSEAAPPSALQSGATATGSSGNAGGIDLLNITIAGAAERIRKKQLSPVELTQAVLNRIEAVNPKLGAFITVASAEAMEAARAAEKEIQAGKYRGQLHGIPVAVKDTHYSKGIRTTASSLILKDFVPDFDCTNVVRLKNAGAILVGKTNLPEFSFGGNTPGCHNPWDLSRNSGGSSGGSGSALGGCLILGATGGDTSGSIRNPASTNGCVGFMPTFGRVSRYGVVPISWTLDHLGPMAKNVEDTAILLKALAGYDAKDSFSAQVPVPDYLSQLRKNIRGMRVGYVATDQIKGFHPDTTKAYYDAVKVFEGLGARTVELKFPERMRQTGGSHGLIRIAEASAYHRDFLRTRADEYKPDSNVRVTVEAGSLLTASQYMRCQRARRLFIQDMYQVFEPLDVLLMPTMPSPADVAVQVEETYRNWWDLCGFPALSMPCGFSINPANLPIGLQIAAKPFQEPVVLAAAQAYETATEWHKHHPNL